ncbi:hypothetical protein [Frigoriflavimonas asaccharolytica]|uniref:Uncharacterized protein n=1 Tax=Frigoriflavimonas asaccharolytica TaxID=2735899 RepID=A0A8J8G640_9FLAO|nr:hypothetical protein [Frigoriflavimonas asaccharolytica]NRS92188.1 hypothetical protein [Frigoriflavimonas asaccharolytica]
MRKILFSLFLSILSSVSFAQNTSDKALNESINKLNTAITFVDLQTVKNDFKLQITETSKWYPSYYAALSVLKQAEMELRANKLENLDILADEASTFLQPILSLQSQNSEIRALLAYVHIIKMGKNSSDFEIERKKAKEILYLEVNSDPANPRFDLLRAQLQYLNLKNKNTNKNFKVAFENAAVLLKAFKPKTAKDPSWGFSDAQYYISTIK